MSHISTRSLINLSSRVGMALRAGVDARKVWELETRHARGTLKDQVERIRQRVASGDPVADAMRSANGYFPPMYVQMVEVGETTGKLDEVLLRLAEHYQHQQQMKRAFWFGIAWPLFELTFAVLTIGLLIFILGLIGSDATIFYVFPVGASGALAWFLLCGLAAGGIALVANAITRGWLGPQPVLLAMKIPVLGHALQSLALSRLTWSLALSLDSAMDAVRAVEMSIRAAQNPYYESALPRVAAAVRGNRQFHESFREAGVFPEDFLNALEAAEMAGATHEALLRLAKDYEDRSRTAIKILTGIATVAVMLLVFGVIIFAIFWMFFNLYMKPINEALEMTRPGGI
jgi:type II secretory pathway component PulF